MAPSAVRYGEHLAGYRRLLIVELDDAAEARLLAALEVLAGTEKPRTV